jgi:hypothetical protein
MTEVAAEEGKALPKGIHRDLADKRSASSYLRLSAAVW